MELDDFEQWARGDGLEIVLLAIGAVLLARIVRFLGDRLVARSQARTEPLSEVSVVASEKHKHTSALLQVGAWSLATGVAVFLVAMLSVLKHLWRPVVGAATPKKSPPT